MGTLMKQGEDVKTDGVMILNISGATCLGLMAGMVNDTIVLVIVLFVEEPIKSENWQYREVAIMAFISILDELSDEVIRQYASGSIDQMIW